MALVDLLNNQESFTLGQSSAYNAPEGSKGITFQGDTSFDANMHLTDRIKWFGDDAEGTGHIPTYLTGQDFGGSKGLGDSAVPDFMLRGGDIENLGRRSVDVDRITKFLFNSPQGQHFILRQTGLQLMNPQKNARVWNLGGNLLAQVAASGMSNIRRDGILPQVSDGLNLGSGFADLIGGKVGGFIDKLLGSDYIGGVVEKDLTMPEKRGIGDVGAGEEKNFKNKLVDFSGLGGVFGGDKGRNYQTTQESKRDKVNYLSIFEVGAKGLSEAIKSYPESKWATSDFVPFRFEVIDSTDPKKSYWIVFRAFLEQLGDQYNASHNEIKYSGRGEKFYTYNAFDRKIQLAFKIAAQTRDEMKPLYQKLNFLVSQTAPNYSSTGRIRTPYMRLTVGDYFNKVPGVLTSISSNWTTNYPWEVKADDGKDTDMLILPHVLDINCSFQPIHAFTPNNSIGDSGNLTPFIGIDQTSPDWSIGAIKNWSVKGVKDPDSKEKEEKKGNGNNDEYSYYTVQGGDRGGALIKKFGCTKEEFCQWNNLNISTWNENSGGLREGSEVKYKTTTQ